MISTFCSFQTEEHNHQTITVCSQEDQNVQVLIAKLLKMTTLLMSLKRIVVLSYCRFNVAATQNNASTLCYTSTQNQIHQPLFTTHTKKQNRLTNTKKFFSKTKWSLLIMVGENETSLTSLDDSSGKSLRRRPASHPTWGRPRCPPCTRVRPDCPERAETRLNAIQ